MVGGVATDEQDVTASFGGITSTTTFGEDARGEIYIASRGGWLAALPNASLIEQGRTNCLLCDEPSVKEAMRCSDKYPREIWNLAGATASILPLINLYLMVLRPF